MGYTLFLWFKSFRHKGLRQLFESGIAPGANPQHVNRLKQIFVLLETAETIKDMDLPGIKLRELRGKRKGTRVVSVSGNWRVTFKVQSGDVFDADHEDDHQRSVLWACSIHPIQVKL